MAVSVPDFEGPQAAFGAGPVSDFGYHRYLIQPTSIVK